MLILDRVSQLVDQNPQAFINGDKELAEAALNAAKYMFDLCMFVPPPKKNFCCSSESQSDEYDLCEQLSNKKVQHNQLLQS